jgi:hypothetical protein
VVHLFRFAGDHIAELWDVGQPVPDESVKRQRDVLTAPKPRRLPPRSISAIIAPIAAVAEGWKLEAGGCFGA